MGVLGDPAVVNTRARPPCDQACVDADTFARGQDTALCTCLNAEGADAAACECAAGLTTEGCAASGAISLATGAALVISAAILY